MRISSLFILSMLFLTGCIKEKKSSSESIHSLLIKYPLSDSGILIKPQFELSRYIKDYNWQAEFEFHQQQRSEGIIIIRKNNKLHAIPLFEQRQDVFKGSFEKELKAANHKLGLSRGSDFFYFRFIFIQVLGLREECPDNNTTVPTFPYQVIYSGIYNIIETIHSRDSITLKVERMESVD